MRIPLQPVLRPLLFGLAMLVGLGGLTSSVATAQTASDRVSFNRDIRPILSKRCFACHGPDEKQVKGGLRLDVRALALKRTDGQAAIVPKLPEASHVMTRITAKDPADRMPPAEAGDPLTPRQVDLIRRWIAQGAPYEAHWSFIKPTRPNVPAMKQRTAVRNPIDAFVVSRLGAEGMKPAPQADRRTLIRRVSLDLVGLPPTPAEVEAFVNDKSPDAYERVVDRLLASPRFGEQQARYWLDAARYADTNGYQYDRQRNQWVWRDWVVHAFNTNKPFDRFTIEQMAGDLLPNATPQTRLATGFHRNHPITIEGGVIDEEYRTEYVMDRVVTTTTTFMGMTFLCARCHDHKYDPLTQDDFYSFYAFFNNVPERGLNGFAPNLKVSSPLRAGRRESIENELAAAKRALVAKLKASGLSLASLEAKLRQQSSGDEWAVIKPTSVRSQGGATLTAQSDGSTLAGGKNPGIETYHVAFGAGDKPIRALRLEAIPHASLTNGSASRGSNGNFVLSEFVVETPTPGQPGKWQRVAITSAEADYEQKDYGIAKAIDGRVTKDGWAVDGHIKPERRVAVFTLAEPIPSGAQVRVRMHFNYGLSHQIGRFRLATPTRGALPTTDAVKSIMKVARDKRSVAQSATLDVYLAERFGGPALTAMTQRIGKLRSELSRQDQAAPATLVMAEMANPRATFVLDRGEYNRPIKEHPVTPRVPTALGKLPEGVPANRLGLARWLVSRDNPLTARVIVNRFWAQLFGVGIVKTVEDFGSQGEWPSHPRLLDWLAVQFMDSGWDTKALLKTMMTSATYRQSSYVDRALYERDPENRLLARGPRFRLDAEVIRDAALSVAGLLDGELGGPSVYPYHPKGLWLEVNNRPGYSRAYPHPTDAAHLYRRSLYTFWKRTVPPPSMSAFDAPTREFCQVQRSRTNTPLQAFVLLHDPQFVEAARALAQRMMREGGRSVDDRLRFGFAACTSRQPNDVEMSILRGLLTERLVQYRNQPASAAALLAVGQSPRDTRLDTAEHAAYTAVARVLLNLSEFLTKG